MVNILSSHGSGISLSTSFDVSHKSVQACDLWHLWILDDHILTEFQTLFFGNGYFFGPQKNLLEKMKVFFNPQYIYIYIIYIIYNI